ncbi:MAG: tetratricopeptide repeat protein [Chitinophagales bacterium]
MKRNLKLVLLCILCLGVLPLSAQKKKKNKKQDKEVTYVFNDAGNELTAERLFFDGQREKIVGNIELAYENFAKAVKQNPKLDAAYYEMAQIEQLGSKYDLSKASIQKALAISPDNIWYAQFYANVLATQSSFTEAAKIYHELRAKNPEFYDFSYREAYYYILGKEYKKALGVYDELEKEVGIQPDISLQKQKLYNELGEKEKALNELKKVYSLDPNDLEMKNKIAEYYIEIGQEEKGVETYEEILKQDPNNIVALTSLADYYSTKGDKEKTLYYQERAFSNPDIPIDAKIGVLYNYIQFFDKRKDDIQDAYTLSDLLIKAHPQEAKGYSIAGDLRNINDEPEKALEYYNKSIEKQKDVFSVWQQIFFINSDLKNYEELKNKTEEAKTYFPNQALVYFFNGMANQQLKDNEEAIKAYNRGVKMTGDNKLLKGQFYANLGNAYNDTKEYEKSDESFDKALEINPKDAYSLNNYSYYLSLRGDKLEKAAEMSLLSNELEPNNSSFLDTYAWILYKKGDYKKALEYQEKAISAGEKPSDTLLEHLGDILYKLGKKSEALTKWKEAKEYGEGSEFLQQKIDEGKLYE